MNVIAKFPGKRPSSGPEERPADAPLSAMDRRVRPRRLTFGRVFGALIILIVLGAGGYGYVRYGLHSSLAVASERVTVEQVRRAPFNDYAPVTGSVAPLDTVFLDTVEGGQVTEVLAEEGALVEPGQSLARLKNTRLDLEVLGRQAQLTEQQNNLANARLAAEQSSLRYRRDLMDAQFNIDQIEDRLDRRRPLAGGAASDAEISDLEAELAHAQDVKAVILESQAAETELSDRNLAQLQSSVDSMTESLDLVRESQADLTLTAPIGGQLTIFDLNVGQVIAAGQRIGQVDSVGAFKITAQVDEFYLNRIAIGQPASVDLGGRGYELTVSKVYPNVADRQFQVDLSFVAEAPEGLRRGQTVRPRIELGETADSLVLANGPYYDETGGTWVLVVSSDGASASRRKVTLGRRNPEFVEVLSGLSDGDRVITSSYESYRDIERIDFR